MYLSCSICSFCMRLSSSYDRRSVGARFAAKPGTHSHLLSTVSYHHCIVWCADLCSLKHDWRYLDEFGVVHHGGGVAQHSTAQHSTAQHTCTGSNYEGPEGRLHTEDSRGIQPQQRGQPQADEPCHSSHSRRSCQLSPQSIVMPFCCDQTLTCSKYNRRSLESRYTAGLC